MPKKAASKVGKPGQGQQVDKPKINASKIGKPGRRLLGDKPKKASRAQFKGSSGLTAAVQGATSQNSSIDGGRKQANTTSSWADLDPTAPRPDLYCPTDEEYDAPGYGDAKMSSTLRDLLDESAPKNGPFTEDGMMPPPPSHMPQHAPYDMSPGSQYYIDNPDEQPMAIGPGLSRANAVRRMRPLPGPGLHRSNATHWPFKPVKKRSVGFLSSLLSALGWGSGTSDVGSVKNRNPGQKENEFETPIQLPSAYDCLVCMSRVLSEQRVLECPQYQCRRPYHADCIQYWLEQCDNSCPHCKQTFPLPPDSTHVPNEWADSDSGTLQLRDPYRVPTVFQRKLEPLQKEYGRKVGVTVNLEPGGGGIQVLPSSDIPVKYKEKKAVPGVYS